MLRPIRPDAPVKKICMIRCVEGSRVVFVIAVVRGETGVLASERILTLFIYEQLVSERLGDRSSA